MLFHFPLWDSFFPSQWVRTSTPWWLNIEIRIFSSHLQMCFNTHTHTRTHQAVQSPPAPWLKHTALRFPSRFLFWFRRDLYLEHSLSSSSIFTSPEGFKFPATGGSNICLGLHWGKASVYRFGKSQESQRREGKTEIKRQKKGETWSVSAEERDTEEKSSWHKNPKMWVTKVESISS